MCSPLLTSLSSSGCPSGCATQHFSTAHAEGPLGVGVQVVLYLPRWYREVPYRLHSSNLRLNPKKYELIRDRVIFLGHVVSSNGIEPDPTKTPTTSQHLQMCMKWGGSSDWPPIIGPSLSPPRQTFSGQMSAVLSTPHICLPKVWTAYLSTQSLVLEELLS